MNNIANLFKLVFSKDIFIKDYEMVICYEFSILEKDY